MIGIGTSELGIGIPIAALGGAMFVHGADTGLTAVERLITGEDLDTATSQALQAVGLERTEANLADGGIGIVLSGGGWAVAKYGALARAGQASVVAARDQAGQAVRNAAETFTQESGGLIGVAVQNNGGHMKVGVQRVGDDALQWSHLENFQLEQPIKISYSPPPDGSKYWVVKVPVPAEAADKAAAQISKILQSQTVGNTQSYIFGQSDCMVYVTDVLGSAGIKTPLGPVSTELLRNIQQKANPLMDRATELRRMAVTEMKDGNLAMRLADEADNLMHEAKVINALYVVSRSRSIHQSTTIYGENANIVAAKNLEALQSANIVYDKILQSAALIENTIDTARMRSTIAGSALTVHDSAELLTSDNQSEVEEK